MQFVSIALIALNVLFFEAAFASYGPPSSGSGLKSPSSPPSHPPARETPPPAPTLHPPPPKPSPLPPMNKPFGMPGVVGLQDGRWIGTDYLGYLSNHIGIDVEILKPDSLQSAVDTNRLHSIVARAFDKENITPSSETTEGPPLPFLHILVTIFPVDRDRFVVIGNSRLFEHLQVLRKDFAPTGVWQGITWENQSITIVNGTGLNGKVGEVVEQLATAFATRYRKYNLGKSEIPQRPQSN